MGDTDIGFQEVTGLEMETEFIEYRPGDDNTYVMQKIPGLKKHGTITLKKGVYAGDLSFWEWFKDVQTNPERREEVQIQLLDEEDSPVVVWTINNAFPVKVSGPDLKSDANEIAIESIELAHEGFEVEEG
jgi:phage tail-like protein